jgi:hypothetical protein
MKTGHLITRRWFNQARALTRKETKRGLKPARITLKRGLPALQPAGVEGMVLGQDIRVQAFGDNATGTAAFG